MPPVQTPPPAPSLALGDIYYVLFRHKWRILTCTLLGFAAAAAMYRTQSPPYESDAKLYIRYVLTDARNLGPATFDQNAKSPDMRGETIMSSEVEILNSLDLCKRVAEAIGPAKILARINGGSDLNAAAAVISQGLTVTAPLRSSIIYLQFKHKDPQVAQPVLRELIDQYYKMQADVHQSKGMLGDFLIQQTDQLRARLMQTEDDLRKARDKAGVVSIDEARKQLADELATGRQQIFSTQAELAEKTSVMQEYANHVPQAAADPKAPAAEAPSAKVEEYKRVSAQADQLEKLEESLLAQFTPENPRVKEIRTQLDAATAAKTKLETDFPILRRVETASTPARAAASGAVFDPATAAAEIIALQAKLKVLNQQAEQLRAEAAKLDQMDSEMSELRRKKELDEANYKLFAASLEQNRISEALSNGRISNISEIQSPSPPTADWSKVYKTIGGVAVAGLVIGLGWAFLIEMYLDRSVRRPIDVERILRLPLFLTVPKLREVDAAPAVAALPAGDGANETTNGAVVAATNGHATGQLDAFHETLRDRLIQYFESRGLVRKPKLIAVTGLAKHAGVTTTAAGLARSLSDTGDGNVLLVDMTAGQGSSQQFVKGRAICGLDEVLDARDNAHVEQNLYVVSENSKSEQLSRNLPQRFTKLVPKLKASDFDYIVFDMPVINQISITPRMAGFMDMVLLVVESEKTERDVVQRASTLLGQSNAQVGVVLNKARNYLPRRLQADLTSLA